MQTVRLDYVPLGSGDWVLDLGCGEGRHAIGAYVERGVHCVGVDLNAADLHSAARKFAPFRTEYPPCGVRSFSLALGDALRLPFPDHSFNLVICSEVLEHVGPYHQVLAEIRRVLKPGGTLAASVPRFWPEWICWALSEEYHAEEGGHLRIFRAGELNRDIEALGFRRYRRHWAHALHSPFWWLKCLLWRRQHESRLVGLYHRLLVWDLLEAPVLTRALERMLNPFLGKSVVMYFEKAVAA